MSLVDAISAVVVVLALLPLAMVTVNLLIFRAPAQPAPAGTRISILIPARNEGATIGATIEAALASENCEIEVIVLDDQSSDGTADAVRAAALRDRRVRLEHAPPLPAGWAGKQRACRLLAERARHEVLMFVDADIALQPQAATLGAGFLLRDARLGLVSGFPREDAQSWSERLVIPWIHVLLLGYLPIGRMRRSQSSAFGAGCGQWMIARRDAYLATGGHAAKPVSLHDGTSLPRTFREKGWQTDIFDGTSLARCRMYNSLRQVWAGFAKSAGEGLATPVGLPVWTLLIVAGHVAPWLLLPLGVLADNAVMAGAGAIGVAANLLLRALLVARFAQPAAAALLHPAGALLVLAINWTGLVRYLGGKPNVWRGRAYGRAPQEPLDRQHSHGLE